MRSVEMAPPLCVAIVPSKWPPFRVAGVPASTPTIRIAPPSIAEEYPKELLNEWNGAALACIELNSLDYFVDPIHGNYLLDILLFKETIQSYLSFLIVLYISLKSLAFSQTEASKTATESLEDANEEVCAVFEFEFFPLLNLLLEKITRSLFITLSLLFGSLILIIIFFFLFLSIQLLQHFSVLDEFLVAR